MFKNILFILITTILVFGCGGGGGGSKATQQPSVMPPMEQPTEETLQRPDVLPEIPLQLLSHAIQAPIIEFGDSLHIGSNVSPAKSNLQETSILNEVSISSGSVQDGVGASNVIDFINGLTDLDEEGQEVSTSISRFPNPPIVHISENANNEQIGYVVRALQIINSNLPHEKRILISNERAPAHANLDVIPDGKIYVDFVPRDSWEGLGVSREPTANAFAGTNILITRKSGDVIGSEVTKARVWIAPELSLSDGEEKGLHTFVHEFLHALGMSGHASKVIFPESVLIPARPQEVSNKHILSLIDREVILVNYTRSSNTDGFYPPLSAENLGSWSDTSFHIRGDINLTDDDVSFGVASRNGLAQPWASGPTPWTNLSNNNELSETVTWNGAILGITNSEEVIVGDASLAVDLTTRQTNINGQLDFTGLEHWGVREAPDESGTGVVWGDGDLTYSIKVRGNSFVQTGGDSGQVTGAFFGSNHEGMGGVLERHDLSGAFGGKH